MTQVRFAAAISVLLVAVLSAASATGSWEITCTSEEGDEDSWKLVISEENGKLAGTLSDEAGDFPLEQIKLAGDDLSFRVNIDDDVLVVDAKISGSSLQGVYKTHSDKGAIKGARRS